MQQSIPPKAKILVVDDDREVLETFVSLLERPEWDIHKADCGRAALESIGNAVPDVILLDIMMPEIDGLTLCRLLKANPQVSHVPIILVTALSDKKSVAAGLDAGADDFLSKPVSGIELQARVRSMLRIKKNHDQLEEAQRLRKDLSDLIVHDLRTPLSVIGGCADLLESSLESETLLSVQTLVDRIRTQAHRMENFLSDLLLTAKLEAGKLNLSITHGNASALVRRATDNVAPLLPARHLSFQLELPESDISWDVDENLVQRVLDNLLTNAIKYSPSCSTIIVHLQQNPLTQAVEVSVADTGPGIPIHLRKTIFEPYSIVQGRKAGGVPVGLGLAFCNMVMQAHQGHIDVASNFPHGSCFTITFPPRISGGNG